jgi:hypothetical protein
MFIHLQIMAVLVVVVGGVLVKVVVVMIVQLPLMVAGDKLQAQVCRIY